MHGRLQHNTVDVVLWEYCSVQITVQHKGKGQQEEMRGTQRFTSSSVRHNVYNHDRAADLAFVLIGQTYGKDDDGLELEKHHGIVKCAAVGELIAALNTRCFLNEQTSAC